MLYLVKTINGYPITAQAIVNFDSRVYRNGKKACWEWIGIVHGAGYGLFAWRYESKQYFLDAHRFSHLIYKGTIPDGLDVCHSCDNKRCVKPDHIWTGTRQENMMDAWQKGRMHIGDHRGEKNGNAKLTAAIVAEIRRRHRKRIVTAKMLAGEFGVGKGTIDAILQGRSWN